MRSRFTFLSLLLRCADSNTRLSATPLRRRLNTSSSSALRAARSTLTTADSSTRNGDKETEPDEVQPLPSPLTSHELVYEEEEGQGSSGDEPVAGADAAPAASEAYAWYRPSYPVLLALAPPVGNWLTGDDHLKDALLFLLLLLIFYLHQLIEAGPPTHAAARARAAPPSPVPPPRVPLPRSRIRKHFSTTLFALFASFHPLRELITRAAARTSTLHALVHAHSASSISPSAQRAQAELEALRTQLARLEARVAAQDGVLTAYVDNALTPLEKGGNGKETHTVFVPASPKPLGLLAGWAASLSLALRDSEPEEPPCGWARADFGGRGRRAARVVFIFCVPSVQPPAYAHAPPALAYAPTPQLLLVLLRRGLALAVWLLRALLLPSERRVALRNVVRMPPRARLQPASTAPSFAHIITSTLLPLLSSSPSSLLFPSVIVIDVLYR
ncbi:hypothetical protein FB451DRAFT_1564980 [Mycena latifolia]|nr:hypothetical protein FB451DRAFT_1564980 [Mycena latifolia]